jgi:hypothetical protein
MERAPQPEADDEVAVLLGWLAFHRDALAAKCEGMTDEQLVVASASPSTLTLLGLVRHMTEMEHFYIGRGLSGVDRGYVYCTEEDEEADIEGLDASMAPASLAVWRDTMVYSDEQIARFSDFDAEGDAGWGSIRAHLLKVIQEYARHNGHADIVRERIDGTRGE